jgi:peptide/nickel transport system substrate-binding protein
MIRTLEPNLKRNPFFHLAGRTCATAVLASLLISTPATAQAPANGQPKAGGTLRIGYLVEPPTLNPYFATSVNVAFSELTLDGLTRGAPDGSYLPVLAAEIPTQANGDVSPDGTVVTWKLKPGVTWSDGQPFTSQDVVFTFNMIMDPANPVINRSDYAVMDSVVAPDDNTVVITYKQLYARYRAAFPYLFPAHVFNGQTNIAQDPFNRAETVGTGPFVFKSWTSGDSLTFDRNPNYREPGKPFLNELVFKVMPSTDVEVQTFAARDVDAAFRLDSSALPQLATIPGASVDPIPFGIEYLLLNASCSSGPRQGDPTCPNAILGDLRVRLAVELAIDKRAMVHGLLADLVKPGTSLVPGGPYAVDLPLTEANPDQSRQLLDQAGWVVGSDGIRTRDGVRAHLVLWLPAGMVLAEQTAQVVAGDLQDVGIETEIKESTTSLAGGFQANSAFALGNFDLGVFGSMGNAYLLDPQATLQGMYFSDQVPNPQTQSGNNWDRIQNPQIDQALMAAGNTLDDAQRQAAYQSFSQLLHADEAVIPLYPVLEVDARRTNLQNWLANPNNWITWNSQDWWFNQ